MLDGKRITNRDAMEQAVRFAKWATACANTSTAQVQQAHALTSIAWTLIAKEIGKTGSSIRVRDNDA